MNYDNGIELSRKVVSIDDEDLKFQQTVTKHQIKYDKDAIIETFELHGNFLLISCSTCNDGKGQVYFYDSQDFSRIKVDEID